MKTVLFYPTFRDMPTWNWFPFPFMTLGAYLQGSGVEVQIVDARVDRDWITSLRFALSDADTLGVTSCSCPDILDALEACRIAKDMGVTTVWGGPHANVLPGQTLDHPLVDAVCYGPGEHSPLPWGEERLFTGKLDVNLFPAYDLVDVEKYRSQNNVAALFSVWGCPHKCTFCDTAAPFLACTERVGFRYFPLDRVKAEISYLVEGLRFKNLFFHDGTFFTNKQRVMDIARFLWGYDVKWKAKARTNSLQRYSHEELDLLRKSGLVSIFFGVESGSVNMLKRMNKGVVPRHTLESLRICKEHGFEFYTAFMAALPYETDDDLRKTITLIEFIKREMPDDPLQVGLYTSIPGTQMYLDTLALGHKPPDSLEAWGHQDVSSDWDRRSDIRSWMPNYDSYRSIFERELGKVKWEWQKEESGEHKSVFME